MNNTQQPPLPTLQPGDSHMESLIAAAIQGHADTRDAMRWLVRQLVPATQSPDVTDEEIDYAVLQTAGFDGIGTQEMNQLDCRNIARAILSLRPAPCAGADDARASNGNCSIKPGHDDSHPHDRSPLRHHCPGQEGDTMSIELKQAAQQTLEATSRFVETELTIGRRYTNSGQQLLEAIEALYTAIQQAESEPVGFVDFQGTVFWHDGPPPADSLLFAAKPVSHDKAKWCEYVAGMVFAWLEMQENLKEEDRCIKAIAGIIERRMWALSTHRPAPGVPDDVMRDAERYRWLCEKLGQTQLPTLIERITAGYVADYKPSIDEAIDAAMLAAK